MTSLLKMLLLIAALYVPRAMACSCVVPGPPPTEAARVDAVFHGEVTAIRDTKPADTWWNRLLWRLDLGPDPTVFDSMREIRYTFRVLEAFKGVTARTVQVSSRADGASCGVSFELGRRYVVYAHDAGKTLGAGLCSLTGPSEDPRSGLQWLRSNKGRITANPHGAPGYAAAPCKGRTA